MLNIKIKEVPLEEMPFTTAGTWLQDNNGYWLFLILKGETISWQYQLIVLMHELIEWGWCMANGVTQAECDLFDELYEKEYDAGIHSPTEEAGFDKRSPYRTGHVWGYRAEWAMCILLGIKWKEYSKFWDDYFTNFPTRSPETIEKLLKLHTVTNV